MLEVIGLGSLTNNIFEETDFQKAGSFLTLSKTGASSVEILRSLCLDTLKIQVTAPCG